MKIAVPSMSKAGPGAPVCPGFFGCTYFTVFDVGGSSGVEVMLSPGGAAAAFTLAGRGVQAVLVREISEVERQTIVGVGMRPFDGASGTAQDAVDAFMGGRLVERSDVNPCCN